MPVEVTFRPLNDDITIPVFKPAVLAGTGSSAEAPGAASGQRDAG
jgi:hypothetical protein